jgi:nucleotide-binding universal stress UspA family protein
MTWRRSTLSSAGSRQVSSWGRQRYPQVQVIEDVQRAHPVDALASVSAKADLVVVGSQGRGAIGTVMLGSVALGFLYHARSSVAVVRP